MSVRITTVAPATADDWDAAWASCPYATYFQSREWAQLWESYTSGRTRPCPLTVTFSDGCTAVLPLSVRRSVAGLVRTYLSSPAGTFGGWVTGDPLEDAHGRALADLVNKLGDLDWRVNPYDPLSECLALTAELDDTHVLILNEDFDVLFRTWSKGHRAAVKQAQREGVQVRLAQTKEDWLAYYATYEDTVARWGDEPAIVYRREFFERMAMCNPEHVRLWLGLHDGSVIAGALCLQASQHIAYWHGAALADEFKRRPVNLILYEAIRDACASGYRWFDFNPSGGHEGVRSFKASFGTTVLPCAVVQTESLLARTVGRVTRVVRPR